MANSTDHPDETAKRPPSVVIARTVSMSSATVSEYKTALGLDPCSYCGDPSALLDHITPRIRFGANAWDNLTASCAACNRRKYDRTLLGFLGHTQFMADPDVAAILAERVDWGHLGTGPRRPKGWRQ